MEIKDVFGAQPKSVWEFLCENGQGLYIPSYQRQYSWDASKINRLIEDTCHGFSHLVSHKDAITFIGTIIAIHDTELLTVEPLVKSDVPSKVMTIIDGQQRLTTLLLINTVLHDEIKHRSRYLDQLEKSEGINWLFEECMKVSSRLGKTFEEDKDYGDEGYRHYPRMIRAYDDSWSRKKNNASYRSPIGNYLHKYGEYIRQGDFKRFKYAVPEGNNDNVPKYGFLQSARLAIEKKLVSLLGDSEELPDFKVILSSKEFQNILLNSEFPEPVHEMLLSDQSDQKLKQLTRLVLLANFILDRVAITIVTARNEDYAFDMFESLNTTGEPLTAFETFKPRIIYSEKLAVYKESESYGYVNTVEEYLESFTKPNEKQDVTSRLIVSFALAESGRKLSTRLSEQRRYLRDTYEGIDASRPDLRREFVEHLSHAAIFMRQVWKRKKSDEADLSFLGFKDEELLICIDLLRQMNHSITTALMIRFFSEFRKANNNQSREIAASNFSSAVKAITAFSVIWRSSRKGTDAIDSIYRELMSSGCSSQSLPPLARASGEVLNVEGLKRSLAFFLKEKGKIANREDWIDLVSKVPSYSNHKESTRFILLAAAHDSAEDPDYPGLNIKGKEGLLNIFNFTNWRGEASQTVEHISPQSRSGNGWEDFDDHDLTTHKLGNLTLLPSSENSSIGNGSWPRKRLIYKILAAETLDQLERLLKKSREQEIDFSMPTTELLNNSRYLPMVRAISKVEGDWTEKLIEDRTRRITELAWLRIAPWLEI